MTVAPFEFQFSAGGVGGKPPEILLLAIRSIDAGPDSPAKAWVFVRRVEHYTYDDGTKDVREASIELTYQAMNGSGDSRSFVGGSFTGSYSRYFGRISLTGGNATSRGGVLVPASVRSLRLGTYLMNAVVGWAKQWPVATVNSIHVVAHDGTPDNRARRNRFYEQFNLVFDYEDATCRAGKSREMLAGQLAQSEAEEAIRKNITVQRVPKGFGAVLRENEDLRIRVEAREGAVKSLAKQIAWREAHPWRALLTTLWARYAQWIVGVAILALVFLSYRYRGG